MLLSIGGVHLCSGECPDQFNEEVDFQGCPFLEGFRCIIIIVIKAYDTYQEHMSSPKGGKGASDWCHNNIIVARSN